MRENGKCCEKPFNDHADIGARFRRRDKHEGQPAIQHLARVSKPGRRVYSAARELPRIRNGLGTVIVSTPRGVLSDAEARDQNVGGEVLAEVF